MAPPVSRRSKQKSPTSTPLPIPLPGIALGLFAAIAGGFAASRALRRKRPAQSSQGEQQSIPARASPSKEREIEIKGKDDNSVLIHANGTITIAHEPSKLAAGLKPAFHAFEEVSFVHKKDAKPLEEKKREDEEEKGDGGNGQSEEAGNEGDFGENDRNEEIMENGKTIDEEGETAEIIVEIEATLAANDASVEAMRSSILEEKEEEEEEEEEIDDDEGGTDAKGKTKRGGIDGVIDEYGDVCEDDDRSYADEQSSPVLINGRILDVFEEMPDFKDEPDLLSSWSNSLSDAVSESSMQEVSSAPVKPFVPAEEAPEALWLVAKPDSFVPLKQSGQENPFPEDKNWSDAEKNFCPLEDGLSEMRKRVPESMENLSQTEQNFSDLKQQWAILNEDTLHLKPPEHVVDVGLVTLKPVLVEIEERESSADKDNKIEFEILSDVLDVKSNSVAFEGKVSIKVNGLDEGVAESATINGKVLPNNGSSLPEELDDLQAMGQGEHAPQSTIEIMDDSTGLICKGENIVESVRINGKVLLDEHLNDFSVFEGITADETGSQTGQEGTDGLQTGHEGTDGTLSDIHSAPNLLAAIEVLGNKTRVSSEGDLHDYESAQEMGCLGNDASEKLGMVEDILEELVPRCTAQKLDVVDDTKAETNVNLEQEQFGLVFASEGLKEGNELSCEGSAYNVERENINDGLSGQIFVEDRIYAKEQEIEEITRSCDANGLVCESKKLTSLTDSAHVAYNNGREVDYSVSKGAVHQHGLQPKGVSMSKALEYLPLGIGFMCLLIALVSYVLWYLEVSPSR